MERLNAWNTYDLPMQDACMEFAKDYMNFLDEGKTERECVDFFVAEAEKNGYMELGRAIAENKQLKAGEVVWFGCDCGKDGDREAGLWDDMSFDFENTLRMDLELSKAEMLDTCESAMNHAMVFTGVNLVKNKPTRWKIENSWGDKVANKGYYVASDTWFDKYVFEAVVDKKYLNKKQLAAMKKKPVVLDPWDPFGSLAD